MAWTNGTCAYMRAARGCNLLSPSANSKQNVRWVQRRGMHVRRTGRLVLNQMQKDGYSIVPGAMMSLTAFNPEHPRQWFFDAYKQSHPPPGDVQWPSVLHMTIRDRIGFRSRYHGRVHNEAQAIVRTYMEARVEVGVGGVATARAATYTSRGTAVQPKTRNEKVTLYL